MQILIDEIIGYMENQEYGNILPRWLKLGLIINSRQKKVAIADICEHFDAIVLYNTNSNISLGVLYDSVQTVLRKLADDDSRAEIENIIAPIKLSLVLFKPSDSFEPIFNKKYDENVEKCISYILDLINNFNASKQKKSFNIYSILKCCYCFEDNKASEDETVSTKNMYSKNEEDKSELLIQNTIPQYLQYKYYSSKVMEYSYY